MQLARYKPTTSLLVGLQSRRWAITAACISPSIVLRCFWGQRVILVSHLFSLNAMVMMIGKQTRKVGGTKNQKKIFPIGIKHHGKMKDNCSNNNSYNNNASNNDDGYNNNNASRNNASKQQRRRQQQQPKHEWRQQQQQQAGTTQAKTTTTQATTTAATANSSTNSKTRTSGLFWHVM